MNSLLARTNSLNRKSSVTRTDGILANLLPRNLNETENLEDVIDLDKELQIYNHEQLQLLNPSTLYQVGTLDFTALLVKSTSEDSYRIVGDCVEKIDIINDKTLHKIKKAGKKLLHAGLIVVGVKGLTRINLGTKVLLTILDTSWADIEKALLGSIEIDMNNNSSLVYYAPGILKTINDITNIKIGIQTKGYENYKGNNLIITVGFLGRATNRSGSHYKLRLDKIIDTLASKGTQLIKPQPISSLELAGLEWNLDKLVQREDKMVQQPSTSKICKNLQENSSIRFGNYQNTVGIDIDSDEESIQNNLRR